MTILHTGETQYCIKDAEMLTFRDFYIWFCFFFCGKSRSHVRTLIFEQAILNDYSIYPIYKRLVTFSPFNYQCALDMRRECEAHMAMIMSYPTRTRGIIVLLKTLPQYGKLTKKKKNYTFTNHFCRAWYCSYTMMAKPVKSLESYYPMVQI